MSGKNGNRKYGARLPVSYIAQELKVDRALLQRKLNAIGFENDKGVTFAEAFDALTSKSERESDRARRLKAEAESAEIDAATKKGTLMLKREHEIFVREIAVEMRSTIQRADYLPVDGRQRLTRELSEIKVKL